MLPVASGILLSVHQKLKLQHAAWIHQPGKRSCSGGVWNNYHRGPTLEEASLNFTTGQCNFLVPPEVHFPEIPSVDLGQQRNTGQTRARAFSSTNWQIIWTWPEKSVGEGKGVVLKFEWILLGFLSLTRCCVVVTTHCSKQQEEVLLSRAGESHVCNHTQWLTRHCCLTSVCSLTETMSKRRWLQECVYLCGWVW